MKSIIITGANSGIGFECAIQMAKMAPDERIILACRNIQAGNDAIDKIKQQTDHGHLICLPLDLSSLQSISDFKAAFANLPDPVISALVNNAGIAPNLKKTAYTKDGFEITFGTNHLGGFYLTLLLLPYIESGGSITFTASRTHDPEAKTGIESPVYTDGKQMAFSKEGIGKGSMKLGQRRYSTSKLCNILTTYILHEKLAEKVIRINAFDPGMVPGTGFAKKLPALIRFVNNFILPLLIPFNKNMNTAQTSGRRLAKLAYAKELQNLNGIYYADGKVIKSSSDSYNKNHQLDLWKSSIELTGIKQEDTTISLD